MDGPGSRDKTKHSLGPRRLVEDRRACSCIRLISLGLDTLVLYSVASKEPFEWKRLRKCLFYKGNPLNTGPRVVRVE